LIDELIFLLKNSKKIAQRSLAGGLCPQNLNDLRRLEAPPPEPPHYEILAIYATG